RPFDTGIPRPFHDSLREAHRFEARVEQREKIATSLDEIEIYRNDTHSARSVEVHDQAIAALLGALDSGPTDISHHELMERPDHHPLVIHHGHRLKRPEEDPQTAQPQNAEIDPD